MIRTLAACGNSGQWAAAFDLFNEMKRDNIQPDIVAYNALLAAGMNGNRPDEVSNKLHEQVVVEPTPRTNMLNILCVLQGI